MLSRIETFLKELCPEFEKFRKHIDDEMIVLDAIIAYPGKPCETTISKFNVTEESKYKIVKGYVQSKKTWAIISIALWYLLKHRQTVFVIVRNNIDDYKQIRDRIDGVIRSILINVGENLKDSFWYLETERGRHIDETYDAAFNGSHPRICVCMRGESDLGIISRNVRLKFATIVDEIDDIDSYRDGQAQTYINDIKSKSGVVWGITATPMMNLTAERILRSSVFVMNRPNGYKDIPTFQFYDLKKECKYSTQVIDDLLICDNNLKEYLAEFSTSKSIYESKWDTYHPRLALVRVGAAVEPQLKLAKYIQETHPSITVITYNGSSYGITLRGNGIEGVKEIFHTHISYVIRELEIKGVEVHPRIIILAGKKADRGISFVSSSFANFNNGLKWHLTELYMVCAHGTSQGNLLQICGRLCGVFDDNIVLSVYSNVGEDLIKAYWVQDEIITRALCGNSDVMKECIKHMPVASSKLSHRKLMMCPLRRVDSDIVQGGWDWDSEGRTYVSGDYSFENGQRTYVEKRILTQSECVEAREKVKEILQQSFDVEFNRIANKMFKRWKSASSNIARLINNIDPDKLYTHAELEAECIDCGVRITDCHGESGKRTRYGNIFEETAKGWRLYPQLVKAWKETFQ